MSEFKSTAIFGGSGPFVGDGDHYLEFDNMSALDGVYFVGWAYWVATTDLTATGGVRIEYTDAAGNPVTYYDTSGLLSFSSATALSYGTTICKAVNTTVRVYFTIFGSTGTSEGHLSILYPD